MFSIFYPLRENIAPIWMIEAAGAPISPASDAPSARSYELVAIVDAKVCTSCVVFQQSLVVEGRRIA